MSDKELHAVFELFQQLHSASALWLLGASVFAAGQVHTARAKWARIL